MVHVEEQSRSTRISKLLGSTILARLEILFEHSSSGGEAVPPTFAETEIGSTLALIFADLIDGTGRVVATRAVLQPPRNRPCSAVARLGHVHVSVFGTVVAMYVYVREIREVRRVRG